VRGGEGREEEGGGGVSDLAVRVRDDGFLNLEGETCVNCISMG
jgi:hypothetical protein